MVINIYHGHSLKPRIVLFGITKRRIASTNVNGTKELAHKIARAAFYMMRDQRPFELDLLFR